MHDARMRAARASSRCCRWRPRGRCAGIRRPDARRDGRAVRVAGWPRAGEAERARRARWLRAAGRARRGTWRTPARSSRGGPVSSSTCSWGAASSRRPSCAWIAANRPERPAARSPAAGVRPPDPGAGHELPHPGRQVRVAIRRLPRACAHERRPVHPAATGLRPPHRDLAHRGARGRRWHLHVEEPSAVSRRRPADRVGRALPGCADRRAAEKGPCRPPVA